MKAPRRKARPKLELHLSAQEPPVEASTVAAEEAREVYVIQNAAIGNVARFVLLHGDPTLPYRERGGVVTVEVAPAYLHPDDTQALVDDLLAVLKSHGQKFWEQELEERAFMRRAHLEVMP